VKHFPRFSGIAAIIAATTLLLACGSDDNNTSTTKATPAAPAATQAAVTTSAPATQAAAATSAASTQAAASTYQPKKVASSVTLQGAGATFPAPIYMKMFEDYNKFDSNVKVNYQAIGSGGGITNFTQKTVDFGASDAFLTDQQYADAGGKDNVILIPTVLGAIVLTYNLPGFNGEIKLTPDTLAGIFMGDIKKWNDAKLKADNGSVNLPDADITVVHRSDGSGTTNGFTTYLSLVNQTWKDKVGAGTSVQWPTGVGGNGNDGVTAQVKQIPGAIGYVELFYATQNKLPTMTLKNKAGNFIKPTLDATAAAATDTSSITPDLNLNLFNTSGAQAYPIVTATWLLLYKNNTDELKGNALVNLVWWMTHDGQKLTTDLGYAPLPKEIVPKVEARLKLVQAAGKPVIPQ